MEILSECPAYGTTVFEAEYTHRDQRFPAQLWLAISNKGVQIYQRGAVAPINTFAYETYVSCVHVGMLVYNFICMHHSTSVQTIAAV